ncbi:hypothetical protein ACGFY7_49310 [Streptomyces prunicolor]|uniref:hypothetical protein n=1 Tax=Streptomyces prunicolor TaxID=67348 RepID=UPI00371BB0B5
MADAQRWAGVPLEALTGHSGEVTSVVWAVIDGRPVLAAGSSIDDVAVWLWDMRDGRARHLQQEAVTKSGTDINSRTAHSE